MYTRTHIHFCAKFVVQSQEYNTHTKDTPLHPFMCNVCKCIECEAGASNFIPEKKVGFSVCVARRKGEGERIAAL